MLSVESLSLWQNHLSIHWSLCCLSKSQSCLGELSIQGVFYLSNFLRFLSSKLVMFHLSHSEKFWAPWQEAKQKLYHIDNYYPRNVPGALYSFKPWSIQCSPDQIMSLCSVHLQKETTLASYWGQLLLMTPSSCQFLPFVTANQSLSKACDQVKARMKISW